MPTSPAPRVLDEVANLCDRAEQLARDEISAATARQIRNRLREPLRVAIAGRVKAGKSTLLNALVGERLAPTDAGECTKIPTWYHHGISYDVRATLMTGQTVSLEFLRLGGRLSIDLGGRSHREIERIEVTWPAARLSRLTLVDTPGLEGMDPESAQRTRRLLGVDDAATGEVDAVIYLMRHVHRLDADFLEAFRDRLVSHPTPVNAIAILSRADEIGAGRSDAMTSATAIADRYASDSRIKTLCATVVPVAGLVAEAGATLREAEVASLSAIASLPVDELATVLLSVDHFADPDNTPIATQIRRDLLVRLGLFGVRFCVEHLRDHPQATASELATALVRTSRIREFVDLLDSSFARRRHILKMRTALDRLKVLATTIPGDDADRRAMVEDIERIDATCQEFAGMRLVLTMNAEPNAFSDAERNEVDRLVTDEPASFRLGLPNSTAAAAQAAIALEGVDRWRRRASHPLTDRRLADACEVAARLYERIYAEVTL